MTPDRFRECLAAIGWSQRGMARQLGIHETRPRRWASGRYSIPEDVADWLERLAKTHEKEPTGPIPWVKTRRKIR